MAITLRVNRTLNLRTLRSSSSTTCEEEEGEEEDEEEEEDHFACQSHSEPEALALQF